jgi:hypothetical protein
MAVAGDDARAYVRDTGPLPIREVTSLAFTLRPAALQSGS